MALCVKINNIKANNSYSIESFYKAIKDKHFSAGVPSLTKYGAASVITFPAIDSQNQVWIMKNGLSTKSHKFSIQKSYEAGVAFRTKREKFSHKIEKVRFCKNV